MDHVLRCTVPRDSRSGSSFDAIRFKCVVYTYVRIRVQFGCRHNIQPFRYWSGITENILKVGGNSNIKIWRIKGCLRPWDDLAICMLPILCAKQLFLSWQIGKHLTWFTWSNPVLSLQQDFFFFFRKSPPTG
jgi:hypothetical protein